ncbi:unnamed protein product [Owenia fusiformis]|uniref:Uncharacterized protein n=1 Tax=Owenia fusiformis TaxID=6347 RepID=A0A8J1UGL9_OWEFU|nr:unnamed protein product [Owenia fusiformis]
MNMNAANLNATDMSATNINNTEIIHPHNMPEGLKMCHLIIEMIVAIMTVLPNGVVLLSYTKSRALQSERYILLMSLSICDFLVGLLALPVSSVYHFIPINYNYINERYLCTARTFIVVVLAGVSIFHLAIVSLLRFITIQWPMQQARFLTSFTLKVIAVSMWIYIIFISFFMFLNKFNIWTPATGNCLVYTIIVPGYYKILQWHVILFMLVCLVSCIMIGYIAWKQQKKIAQIIVLSDSNKEKVKMEKKYTKTLLLIVGLFFITYLPFTIFSSFRLEIESVWLQSFGLFISMLTLCNSAMNPWVYALRHKTFRHAMLRTLKCAGIDNEIGTTTSVTNAN